MNSEELSKTLAEHIENNGGNVSIVFLADEIKIKEIKEGTSLFDIGKGLEADGILTAANKEKWRSESIKKILKNEKYIGEALLQKTYTIDLLSKKRVANNGIVPQYYVENNHEAIIPRELYMQVQEKLVRRANLYDSNTGGKRVYSSKICTLKYCFLR